MLAGALLTLFLHRMLSKVFKELEAKQSVVIHCHQTTHSLLTSEAHLNDQTFRIFHND